MSAVSGNYIGSANEPQVTTVVDSEGRVRRKWGPGDPWTDDFYFGGGELG